MVRMMSFILFVQYFDFFFFFLIINNSSQKQSSIVCKPSNQLIKPSFHSDRATRTLLPFKVHNLNIKVTFLCHVIVIF